MEIITARGHQLRRCRKSSLQDVGLGLGDGALGRKVRKRGSLFLPQAEGSVVLRPPLPHSFDLRPSFWEILVVWRAKEEDSLFAGLLDF